MPSMVMMHLEVSPAVAEALTRQACALLLSRNQYARSLLAAIAKEAATLEAQHGQRCPFCGAERRRRKSVGRTEAGALNP